MDLVKELGESGRYNMGLERVEEHFAIDRIMGTGKIPPIDWAFRIDHLPVYTNKRMKTTGGFADYTRKEIRIHSALVESPELRTEFPITLFHEISHHISWNLFQQRGHGRTWRWINSQFDYTPRRCHNNGSAFKKHKNLTKVRIDAAIQDFIKM